jgi:recombination protein RecT
VSEIRENTALVAQTRTLFVRNQKRFLAGAPRGLYRDPARLLSVAYNAITYDEKLLRSTQASLLGGVMEAIKLGLLIGGAAQECWLVPFFRSRTKAYEAVMIIGYQGYRNIIDRGRAVLDLMPYAVHHDDEFDWWLGDSPRIIHKPHKPVLVKADLKAAYCVAHLRGGGTQFRVMMIEEIEQHRNRSQAKESGPWANAQDYVPMALKTTVRQLAKYVPKSSDILMRALELDNKADSGESQGFDLDGFEVFDGSIPGQAGQPGALPAQGETSKLERLKQTLGVAPPQPVEVPRAPGGSEELSEEENARLDQELFGDGGAGTVAEKHAPNG